jgi:putative transposase
MPAEASANAGSRPDVANSSPPPTSMSFSLCRRNCAALALHNKKVIYGLLLRASAETLLEVARNPRHLRAEIGFFSVLHTWNQKLQLLPHVHCVVPAGGLSLDHTRWVRPRPRFFLPIQVLRRVFRAKFVAALKSAFQHGQLHFSRDLALLAQPKLFSSWLRPLFRKDWIVYSKPPFGGPEYVLQYLGRYTHRVAISNHRLISLANGQVTFRWRDSAHHNEQRLMTLSLDEFLRRFLLHVSPSASFASATSAFSPTVGAPRYCRYASQHWAQFHHRSNQEPPLPRNRTLFGAAPSVADRWQLSNDLPLLKSNSVLHHRCSLLRHETARPQLETSARLTALRPRAPCS